MHFEFNTENGHIFSLFMITFNPFSFLFPIILVFALFSLPLVPPPAPAPTYKDIIMKCNFA